MPKIDDDAGSVAEHRARQLDALLDAAATVLVEEGPDRLSFAILGERTGLVRSSVYRYFSSVDDVIAHLCERDVPRTLSRLRVAMAATSQLDPQLRAFVETQLRLMNDGDSGRLARALSQASLGGPVRARIKRVNYAPAEVLEEVLVALRHPAPQVASVQVQGLVAAGVRLLYRSGMSLPDVSEHTLAAARGVLIAPASVDERAWRMSARQG